MAQLIERSSRCLFLSTYIFFLFSGSVLGQTQEVSPVGGKVKSDSEESLIAGDPRLDALWISEKNGDFLPLDIKFNDASGEPLLLSSFIDRPTILLPIYFYCPSACSLNLANLAKAIALSTFQPGEDFKIIALSFNDKESDENARMAKRNYLRLLPKDFPANEWKFLTGSDENIRKITDAIGYTFKPAKDGMFIHPSALAVVGSDGLIIKYVYGSFVPGDVDMAISEALKGKPALSVKRLLGFCFNYDPIKSKTFFKNLKLGVLAVSGVLGILFFLYLKRGGKKGSGPYNKK